MTEAIITNGASLLSVGAILLALWHLLVDLVRRYTGLLRKKKRGPVGLLT